MDISAFKRDSASLENGVWVESPLGANLRPIEGVSLKVRGTDSDRYAFAFSRKQLAADGDDLDADGTIKPEAMLRIRQELLADVILVDWSGLTQDGEAVAYDADLAKRWLTDPDFRDFQDLVQRAAITANRRVREKTEAAVKN